MSSRNAWLWAFTAAVLLLALVVYERVLLRPSPGPSFLIPGFQAADVQSVQVLPREAPEIMAARTNGGWELVRPLVYPAQAASIEALLGALETMVPATTISGADLKSAESDRVAFGLEPPRASLVFSVGTGRQQLLIGSLTAPGDQVFVQAVGREGVSVVGTDLLKLVPTTAAFWRDTGLFELSGGMYDTIVVSGGEGVLELKRSSGEGAWRIVRPMQARADGVVVGNLIQSLRDLTVLNFVTDDPRADRAGWGLLPAALEIAFMKGTNRIQTLQFGLPDPNATNAVYAAGRVPASVVTVRSEPLEGWRATPNEFRDRQLVQIPREPVSIQVLNGETFTLVKTTNRVWRVEPAGFAADPDTVRRFLVELQSLRVTQFVKDVVAEPDLPEYGLATPTLRVLLNGPASGEPPVAPVLGLEFGTREGETVFVRRVDENAVFGVDVGALNRIPAAAGHFRQRAIWSFGEDQVSSVTLGKGDRTWRLTRGGLNQWSLAPGSQGIINAFAVEEAIHRLGQLQAVVWTDWNQEDTARYGLDDDSLTLTVELEDGARKSVRFGFPSPAGHIYAATTLDGGTWVFEFPRDTFDLLQSFLIQPSNLR